MSDRKCYRWPQGYKPGFVPWYVALRRLVFWPLLFAGRCICFVAALGGHGLDEAKEEWLK
jgi:hypothetical protein